jgi:hypothetical protein
MNMNEFWRTILWEQFGAAIDMLDNALDACPEALWQGVVWPDDPGYSDFWYVGYHTLFWLDFYLSATEEGFAPPPPFGLEEMDPAGVLPPRVYTKVELRDYLAHCRCKCQVVTTGLTLEQAQQPTKFGSREMSFAALLLYNMRHVQDHAAQLSLFLGQQHGVAARWVAKAKEQ